jgi:hypothetical protein
VCSANAAHQIACPKAWPTCRANASVLTALSQASTPHAPALPDVLHRRRPSLLLRRRLLRLPRPAAFTRPCHAMPCHAVHCRPLESELAGQSFWTGHPIPPLRNGRQSLLRRCSSADTSCVSILRPLSTCSTANDSRPEVVSRLDIVDRLRPMSLGDPSRPV